MALSNRFKEMKTRLAELKRHMLPRQFSPTGDYTERQLDRARGYRLLVHAEIESYLEDISRNKVTAAVKAWENDNKVSRTLIALLASYHSSWNIDDSTNHDEIIKLSKERKNLKESIRDVLKLAQKQFGSKVGNNHGIKQNNFKTIMLPTGLDLEDVDDTWLANLDSYGSLRGDIAHKTSKATKQINPQDEYKNVQGLLVGLEELDRKVNSLSIG